MFDLLIKNAVIVNDDEQFMGAVAVKDEKIAAIMSSNILPEAKKSLMQADFIYFRAEWTHMFIFVTRAVHIVKLLQAVRWLLQPAAQLPL